MPGRDASAANAAVLLAEPGTYALFCRAADAAVIRAGGLGPLRVSPGLYVYVGSALGPGGLRGRLAHHLRPVARPHWHIDFLRAVAPLECVWYAYGEPRREHLWAAALASIRGATVPFAGFGASDCECPSHLFRLSRPMSKRSFTARLCMLEPAHPHLFALELQDR